MKLKLISIAALCVAAGCTQEKKSEQAEAPPQTVEQQQAALQQQQGFAQQPANQQQGAPQQQGFGDQQGFPQQGGQQQDPQQQQGLPQQQQGLPQQQQGAVQPQQQGADLDALMAAERQDYGVAPTSELHTGAMHGPTPNSIPGGQVITTKGLVALVGRTDLRQHVFDVLGGAEIIPGSLSAVPAHAAGSFNDATQQQFGQFLQQTTGGDKQAPLVFYCLSTQCWMSYNASLRAINLGYTNVLWYRGGIEAWKQAGQQVQSSQGGFHQ